MHDIKEHQLSASHCPFPHVATVSGHPVRPIPFLLCSPPPSLQHLCHGFAGLPAACCRHSFWTMCTFDCNVMSFLRAVPHGLLPRPCTTQTGTSPPAECVRHFLVPHQHAKMRSHKCIVSSCGPGASSLGSAGKRSGSFRGFGRTLSTQILGTTLVLQAYSPPTAAWCP